MLENPNASKDLGQDEKEFPAMEVITQLDLLATKRLSELSNKASPVEKTAVASLLENSGAKPIF